MTSKSAKGYYRQLTNASDSERENILKAIHHYGTPRDYTKAILRCESIDEKRKQKKEKEEERLRKKLEKETAKQKEKREKKEKKEKSSVNMKFLEDSMEIHHKHILGEEYDVDEFEICPICGYDLVKGKDPIEIFDLVTVSVSRDDSSE